MAGYGSRGPSAVKPPLRGDKLRSAPKNALPFINIGVTQFKGKYPPPTA
jgi:hypothetical protein